VRVVVGARYPAATARDPLVAAPLPQCTAGEQRAVEAGLHRCTCLPEEATVCRGGDCSCVAPAPKEKDSNDSVFAFLLGLAIGAF